MEQLQRVDRVQALESLMAYKTLANDIKTYLESFKDSGKIVTKKDIEEFFAVSICIQSEKVTLSNIIWIG
jgi:E3 ubiquitin-protein ligase UBR7